MIDNFKLEHIGDYYKVFTDIRVYEPFERFGLSFYPRYNRNGNYSYHSALYHNLLVKIYGDRLTIENSLHKFYHGYNHSDFTHSEIVSAIEAIENYFKIPSEDLYFRRVEIALNINYPEQVHEQIQHYKLNQFENMRKGKTVYGKKCFMSEYNIKFYNKYIEDKLNNNSYINDRYSNDISIPKTEKRYEVEYKKMRPLKGTLTTLSDLKKKRVILALGQKIIKYFDSVVIQSNYDYRLLTPRQRELVFAGSNSDFWDTEKINMNTRSKKMKLYNSCIKMLDNNLSDNPKYEVKNLMLEKIHHLVT